MADNVQWIKMKVGMFDGESFKKIKRAKIGGVPFRDKLTAVWFELLDLAGKSNSNGCLVDSNEIPYRTYEDIAVMIDRDETEVELCMQFFISQNMVEIIDDIFCLTNFVQYQNQHGLEKIREQKRVSQAKWRSKKNNILMGNFEESEICVYCGGKADTTDHIVPKVKGGKDILSNLVPACKRCNCTKKERDLLVFLNDPFSDFINIPLVLSNKKLGVTIDEETGKFQYVDVYKSSTHHLPSNSISYSYSNSISNNMDMPVNDTQTNTQTEKKLYKEKLTDEEKGKYALFCYEVIKHFGDNRYESDPLDFIRYNEERDWRGGYGEDVKEHLATFALKWEMAFVEHRYEKENKNDI